MALDPNEVLVAPTGHLYLAPEATAGPADLTTAWPAAWVDLGYLSEDAVTMSSDAEETEIGAWQSDNPIWSNVSVGRSIQFQLMQWNEDTLLFAFGGGTYTEGAGFFTYTAPPVAGYEVSALGLEVIDGSKVTRLVWHRVKITDMGDVTFKGDEAAMLDLTVKLLDNGAAEPWFAIKPLATGGATLAAPRPTTKAA